MPTKKLLLTLRRLSSAALLGMLILSCRGGTTLPTLPPAPSPPPPSRAISVPLVVDGTEFRSRGQRVTLLGSILCCADGVEEGGFPLITPEALLEIAQYKGNFTHIRLGPYAKVDPDGIPTPSDELAYLDDGSFNELFWDKAALAARTAQELGIYLEVDLVDGWALKVGYSWWTEGCTLYEEAPDFTREQFIRKAVQTLGPYPNVLWEVGNENGAPPCGRHLSVEWEEGVARVVRDEERRLGQSRKPIGTNSQRADLESSPSFDYIERHEDVAQPLGAKPVMVNESGLHLTVDDWAREAERACSLGTVFHMWRSGWNRAQVIEALGKMKVLREGVCK